MCECFQLLFEPDQPSRADTFFFPSDAEVGNLDARPLEDGNEVELLSPSMSDIPPSRGLLLRAYSFIINTQHRVAD